MISSNCKINGHFSIENHRFSGAILHQYHIFNRKFQCFCNLYWQYHSPRSSMDSIQTVETCNSHPIYDAELTIYIADFIILNVNQVFSAVGTKRGLVLSK